MLSKMRGMHRPWQRFSRAAGAGALCGPAEGTEPGLGQRVRHQHRISFGGEAPSYFTQRWPKSKCVGPDDDGGMRPAGGMNESRIARAIRRLDVDVRFNQPTLREQVRARRSGGEARTDRYCDEVSACDVVFFHRSTPLTADLTADPRR